MSEQYLIYSREHEAWWRPESKGYTVDESKAGRYSKSEAEEICNHANWRGNDSGREYRRKHPGPSEFMYPAPKALSALRQQIAAKDKALTQALDAFTLAAEVYEQKYYPYAGPATFADIIRFALAQTQKEAGKRDCSTCKNDETGQDFDVSPGNCDTCFNNDASYANWEARHD